MNDKHQLDKTQATQYEYACRNREILMKYKQKEVDNTPKQTNRIWNYERPFAKIKIFWKTLIGLNDDADVGEVDWRIWEGSALKNTWSAMKEEHFESKALTCCFWCLMVQLDSILQMEWTDPLGRKNENRNPGRLVKGRAQGNQPMEKPCERRDDSINMNSRWLLKFLDQQKRKRYP